ncbi:MAG: hypothetical protein QM768_04140 [Agriterribacter sp.]
MKKYLSLLAILFLYSCQKELPQHNSIVTNSKTEDFFKENEFSFEVPVESSVSNRTDGCGKLEVSCYDLFLNTYIDGDLASSQYLYTECTTKSSGDCGRTGGGDSRRNEIIEVNSPCPQSFTFSKIVSADTDGGGWQQAGVSGIHFNYISSVKGVKSRFVSLPVIYFGMPITRLSGDYYSSANAAANAARAVRRAEVDAVYYGRKNPSASDENVAAYWLERINFWMKSLFSGSATKLPAASTSPTPAPAKAVEGC